VMFLSQTRRLLKTLILTFSQSEKERCWRSDDPKLSAGSSFALSRWGETDPAHAGAVRAVLQRASGPRSIASQLVLLFTLAAALLLFCGLGAFYLIVVRHAFEEDNEFLADRVSAWEWELSQSG